MKVSEILMDAADTVGRLKWKPRPPKIERGECCAVTAIHGQKLVVIPWRLDSPAFQAQAFMDQRLGTWTCLWNDRQRSAADVQHALRLGAIAAMQEGK